MTDDTIAIEVRVIGNLDNAEVLPDGTRILYNATIITEPGNGQVRDLIIWPDGSVHLGTSR